MRRLVISLLAAALLLIGGVVAGSTVGGAAAQPETVPSTEPAAVTEAPVGSTQANEGVASTEAHPLIGTWNVTEVADPEHPFVLAFSADGTVVSLEEGVVGLGVWELAGPTSAALTITEQLPAEEVDGVEGATITIRAAIEVAPDGQSFSADYTVEAGGMEWMPTGEHGPGSVTGTRVAVEPMGTPVGSLEDLFGSFEGTEPASDDTVMVEDTAIVTEASEAAPPTTS